MPYHNFFVSTIHLFCYYYTTITVQPYLRAQPPLRKSSQLAFLTFSAEPNCRSTLRFTYFPTFSAEPKRKDNLRLISLHLLRNLNVEIPIALLSLFPRLSAKLKREDNLRFAFPISQHLVITLNVGKIFTLLSLFPYI